MKNRYVLLMVISLALSCGTHSIAQSGKPLVFAISPKSLEKTKTRLANKDESLSRSYKQLIKDADKALQFGPVSVMEKKNDPPSGDKHDYMSLAPYFWPDSSKPGGMPYMRKDGQTNPEVKDYKDKDYLPKLCESVYTLGLAYYFSENNTYADHAAKLVRVWFLDTATRMNPNLNYGQAIKGVNDGRGAGMIDTRHFVKLIDGINLVKNSKSWKSADQQKMQDWFAAFLNWMQTSKVGTDEMKAKNNHGAWYDAQRLAMALYLDSTALAKKIIANAENRLDYQLDENGAFPAEMERTISLHYTVFVMEAFFNIANMADKVGIDFWNYTSPSGKSLKKAMAVLKPYLTEEKTWTGEQIKEFDAEEGYPLLLEAAAHYKCKDCVSAVQRIADDKGPRLRLNLIYN